MNERVRDLNRGSGVTEATLTVICECGDGACTERIEIAARAYERVRSNSRDYVTPSELARELDPRS